MQFAAAIRPPACRSPSWLLAGAVVRVPVSWLSLALDTGWAYHGAVLYYHYPYYFVRTTSSNSTTSANGNDTTTQVTSPTTEKKERHHTRRKSGKEYVVVTERKGLVRPAALTRRSTGSQYVTKTATTWRESKESKESNRREKEREDRGEDRVVRDRDHSESFPQYCMTCEKQFVPANSTFLYCSEDCRLHDRSTRYSQSRSSSYSATSATTSTTPTSPTFTSPYGSTQSLYGISSPDDGPDILPRFSPTQSQPRSYYPSDPDSFSREDPISVVQPMVSTSRTSLSRTLSQGLRSASGSSTALASLRELATALPRNSSRTDLDASPVSSTSPLTKAWNLIPFTSSKYGNGSSRSREDLPGYAKTYGGMYAGAQGMDRPLPPRSGPSGYGHRPRSVDLVTPFSVEL
ncbi:hypothetical protein F5884DRAFT_824591 [Xylogone sp. PMI_703]|nr:hypothetical protein F5884DRAFT_824591 [Xylogone sp. PMI_703]